MTVSFSRNSMVGKVEPSDPDAAEGSFHYVPTRNPKTGRLEMNILPRKDFYPTQVNEVGPQYDFMHYKKPSLLDALVNKHTKDDLEKLLEVSHDAFAKDERQIGTTPFLKMSIDTGKHSPTAKKPYALALKHYDWVRDEIDKLLEAGVIRESHSSWSAPIVVVAKGDDGKRLCMDFRALNAITRAYAWPMPGLKTSLLKLRSSYHHVTLDNDAIRKTAFVMPLGKYEYLKVQFGLAQAPTYFQNLINKVLNRLHFTLAYLDDVIIFSKSAEQHLQHIQIVLTRLKQAKL